MIQEFSWSGRAVVKVNLIAGKGSVTLKCFVQIVSQCFGDIARQVARNISKSNSALRLTLNESLLLRVLLK